MFYVTVPFGYFCTIWVFFVFLWVCQFSVFDHFLKSAFPDFGQEFGFNSFGSASFPKVDVIDLDDKIQIEAEIPGMNKEDVKISVKDGMLCISTLAKSV